MDKLKISQPIKININFLNGSYPTNSINDITYVVLLAGFDT